MGLAFWHLHLYPGWPIRIQFKSAINQFLWLFNRNHWPHCLSFSFVSCSWVYWNFCISCDGVGSLFCLSLSRTGRSPLIKSNSQLSISASHPSHHERSPRAPFILMKIWKIHFIFTTHQPFKPSSSARFGFGSPHGMQWGRMSGVASQFKNH